MNAGALGQTSLGDGDSVIRSINIVPLADGGLASA